MTADDFKSLALSFPETIESAHMDHPDFRVGGKIFATLVLNEDRGMAKLNTEQQGWFLTYAPESFEPAAGVWGERGATIIMLENADETLVRRALNAAWRNTAPRKLVQAQDKL
jgi:hypothetical protein